MLVNKLRKQLLFLAAILLLPSYSMLAQPYSTIEDEDILKNMREVLRTRYPLQWEDLQIGDSYQIDLNHSMLTYEKDGVYHEAIINSKRKEFLLIAIAVQVPEENVPHVVMQAFENGEHGDREVVKTFWVKTPYEEDYYALDVVKNDTTERLFFNPLGVTMVSPY